MLLRTTCLGEEEEEEGHAPVPVTRRRGGEEASQPREIVVAINLSLQITQSGDVQISQAA